MGRQATRDSGDGKSAVFDVRVWRKGSERIAIASTEAGFISTVSNNPRSKRFHPNLYKKLEKVLLEHGK